jgi:prolipoprotein diacylglyceryltransferase
MRQNYYIDTINALDAYHGACLTTNVVMSLQSEGAMIEILLAWIFVSIPVGILIGQCIGRMSNGSNIRSLCSKPVAQELGKPPIC